MELTQDNIRKLNQLIAKPASVNSEDAALLAAVSERYPYFQPIHLLLAKASGENRNQDQLFAKAAIYNNGALLHMLIHQPDGLKTTDDFNVLSFEPSIRKASETKAIVDNEDPAEFMSTEVSEPFFVETTVSEIEHAKQNLEVFEVETVEQEFLAPIESEEPFEEIANTDSAQEHFEDQILEAESLAVSDFFAFENTIADTITEVKEPVIEEYNQQAEDENVVTKYDDDNLPYTFLWWLAKTRKEHEQIFRPYATARPQANPQMLAKPGQLQHQYVEHIFHIQTPFSETDITSTNASVSPTVHKSDEIIEKFIHNDPHIRALKPEQIDNENKAKKSSEDSYDLVSETLAEVYIEQMLYHKAIDTYQKLSLKFPEKSSYFADLIHSLEKKI